MNVPNENKVPFREMTAEERSAIVEAWLIGNAEYFSVTDDIWHEKVDYSTLVPGTTYRTKPRQLTIPWDVIKPEYKWAAMDDDGVVYFHKEMPSNSSGEWIADYGCSIGSYCLNIDKTGIDWRESLVQRPEGG